MAEWRGPVKRYAIVHGARSWREIEAYLPENYQVLAATDMGVSDGRMRYVIQGRDTHGWTLHDYVSPRLSSGLMRVEEIDLSHPVMKTIEDVHDMRATARAKEARHDRDD